MGLKKDYLILGLILIGIILISGCTQKEEESTRERPEEIQETIQSQGLGNLCSGEEECISFCLSNRGRCEDYCRGNENELCSVIFPPEENQGQQPTEDNKPILKNLGVNIDAWNKQTNLAGDIAFDRQIIFEDDFIKNDRPFLEFGNFEHTKENPGKLIENWFFVKSKTKVMAPADGKVYIGFIEHTKDWSVSMQMLGSPWIVSIEHLLNLEVEEGDQVKAGDILGEAVPKFGVGFTELAVWTGGREIYKYCPFDFLDESLKPVYTEKLNKLASDWEEFVGKNIYEEEKWVSPGCLVERILEN